MKSKNSKKKQKFYLVTRVLLATEVDPIIETNPTVV